MYAFWDGYKLDEEEFIPLLRNLFNFIVPIKPFSLLDTYGFSVLLMFFYRFKHKDEIVNYTIGISDIFDGNLY